MKHMESLREGQEGGDFSQISTEIVLYRNSEIVKAEIETNTDFKNGIGNITLVKVEEMEKIGQENLELCEYVKAIKCTRQSTRIM